ncbi:MAG: PQQ-binding-like beta-propeller repeat protein [Roseibacillus sp.]|nr:PQQ-binding-like beta-propeller repeat protein [Roseibacillus sp.]
MDNISGSVLLTAAYYEELCWHQSKRTTNTMSYQVNHPTRFAALLLTAGSLIALTCTAAAEERLLEWHAHKSAVKAGKLTAVKGPAGTIAHPPAFDADGHLIFDGKQEVIFPEAKARILPLENFTVHARVRVDQTQNWGCLIGYTQDNGAHERGWLLGYNGDRFSFKLSTGGSLTAAVSGAGFTTGQWVDLMGLYDGKAVHLFINGLHAGARALTGKVALPREGTPFVLGAYKDDDEHFPMTGRIASVKISKGLPSGLALPNVAETPRPAKPSAPASQPKPVPKEERIDYAVHPRVAFLDSTTAVISWQAATDAEAILYYGIGKTFESKLAISGREGKFSATLPNLLPATEYKFRIATGPKTKRKYSPIHSLDTRFNLSPAPAAPLPGSPPALVEYAEKALSLAPDQSGYALVLGLHNGRLASLLAAQSRFHVIAADSDPAVVAEVRKTLYNAGLLGHRVTVVHLPENSPTPWTKSFADLILSERAQPAVSLSECRRLVRPNGGLILLPATSAMKKWRTVSTGWTNDGEFLLTRRDDLAGAQDWTHQYGTPGNAAYTGETLGEVSASSGMGLQWIGHPGGDFGIDRQPRMPAPLAANGRLYHQGMDRLVALNAFNGAVLWSYEIPALRRLNVPHDCSNWCADDDHVFVAIKDRLWIFDGRTGVLKSALQLPTRERELHEWGFVANEGEILVGSAVRSDSAFLDFWGGGAWFDKVGGAGATTQICSERLFGYRKSDAKGLWAYGRGAIINSTISLHNGKLYFLENRNPKLMEGASGRVSDRRLWIDLTAVCLDAKTGQVLWDEPGPKAEQLTEKIGFVQSAYGIATDEGFLTVLSEGKVDAGGTYLKTGKFLCSMYEGSGQVKWKSTSPWAADHHGLHISHPVVTEERLYLSPHIHDLKSGKSTGKTFGPRRGCSTIVATKSSLMFRILGEGNSPLGFWNQKTGSVSRFMRLRPSCWLNTLPTQGMLLVPEGGAGCSCGGWMETSVGFLPRAHSNHR